MATEDVKTCGGALERLSKLPTVGFVVGKAKSFVSRARNSNSLFRIAVNTTENALHYATPIISAVVMRFDKPVRMADDAACWALVKLEEKFPVIKKSPEEISQMAKDTYEQTIVTPVTIRANGAKNYGLTKITDASNYANEKWTKFTETAYGEAFVNNLSTTVTSVDQYIEGYFPKSQEKNDWKLSPEDELPTKLRKLVTKLYQLLVDEIRQKQQAILNFLGSCRQVFESGSQQTLEVFFGLSSNVLVIIIPRFETMFPSLAMSLRKAILVKQAQETPGPPKEKKPKES